MGMILLDWTRMGKAFCLAGAVLEGGAYRIVRPLLMKNRNAPVRNVGWPVYWFERRCRWEIFDLVGAEPAEPQPPHREDIWVQAIRPRDRVALPEQRRAILQATAIKGHESLFGAPLLPTHTAAHLPPGTGLRSLATIIVPADQMSFSYSRREGLAEPDIRVVLPIAPMDERHSMVKDHHLLLKAEQASRDPSQQIVFLKQAIQQMGNRIAVRLGLSRPFQGDARHGSPMCWLMADGFFSWDDPQP